MKKIVVCPLVALFAVNLMTICCWAQEPFTQELKIEIYGQPESTLHGYSVRVLDLGHHAEIGRAYADSGGVFTVRSIPNGDYNLEICNGTGEVVKDEFIRVNQTNSYVRIGLPQRQIPRPAATRVSVTQLRHPPAKQAVKAFETARKYSESGQPEKAAEELEKAVRISPDFAEAYTNLAANHIRLRQYQRAAAEANRAMEIGAPNVTDLCNLALAEWGLQRYEDAMGSAKQALRLDGNAPTAHFVLGTLLAMDPKTRHEGIQHLERAADRNPSAAKNLEIARAQEEQ